MKVLDEIMHFATLLILIFVLLFILTWANFIRCGLIPGWCDIYYKVVGKPRVLVVYGNDGEGNPHELTKLLSDSKRFPFYARKKHLSLVSEENLKRYSLVIVEHAKTMSNKDLEMFFNYVLQGGRLVWVADSGQKIVREIDSNITLQDIVPIKYEGEFCKLHRCDPGSMKGTFVPDEGHPLVYGVGNVPNYWNFSVVEETDATNRAMSVKIDGPGINLKNGNKNVFPVIFTTNLNRVAYYAIPPEKFAEKNYYTLIEQLYYGMLH